MNSCILKNSFAGIAAIIAAVSFGYFAVQYFGQNMMLAISTGMFVLGAVVHRTKQLPHQKSLPKTLVVTELKAKLTQSDKEVKKQSDYSINKNPANVNLRSITVASRFVRTQVKVTKFASTSRSYGYCRKRLALYHKARIEK